MPMRKSQLEANNRHLAAYYESIAIRARKDERIGDRLKIAASRKGTSKRDYILNALRDALDADGVTVDTFE